MKPHVLQAALWTIAFALLFYWFVAFAAAGALRPADSYTQHPALCQKIAPIGGK